jgi:hypothetical protein
LGLIGKIGLIGALTISPLAPAFVVRILGFKLLVEGELVGLGLCVSTAPIFTKVADG